jgi:hypothetical protein
METLPIVMDEFNQGYEDECSRIIGEVIAYARHLNFPKKSRQGVLLRQLHGTEFLHGLLQEHGISNDLYQQLKRLAEDTDMEYEIQFVSE